MSVSVVIHTRNWPAQSRRAQPTRPVSSGRIYHAAQLSLPSNWPVLMSPISMASTGTAVETSPQLVRGSLSGWSAFTGKSTANACCHSSPCYRNSCMKPHVIQLCLNLELCKPFILSPSPFPSQLLPTCGSLGTLKLPKCPSQPARLPRVL